MGVSIPVLYYHRVGAPDPWHLSVPVEDFRQQLSYLRDHGWNTLSMARFVRILAGSEAPPHRPVLLTFDDGFRDNARLAFPVMREIGARATLFLATGLIRPDAQAGRDVPRPFTEAHTAARRGDYGDFVSQAELADLAGSGLFDVHAHGHEHGQVFTDTMVEGVYPRTTDHWGILSAYRQGLETGLWPVFPRAPALLQPALWPRCERLAEFSAFLEAGHRVPVDLFDQETMPSYDVRVEQDLRNSLALTAPYREKECAVICWPWGRYSPPLEKKAQELGCQVAFRTETGPNIPGSRQFAVYRCAVKKPGLTRFAFGLLVRSRPLFARLYGILRGFA